MPNASTPTIAHTLGTQIIPRLIRELAPHLAPESREGRRIARAVCLDVLAAVGETRNAALRAAFAAVRRETGRRLRRQVRELLEEHVPEIHASACLVLEDRRTQSEAGCDPLLEGFALRMHHRGLREFLAAYERCGFRRARGTWAGGEHDVTVRPGPPSVCCSSQRAWSHNRRWRGLNSAHHFRIEPVQYLRHVVLRKATVVSECLVLDVQRADTRTRRTERLVALVVQQGRGFSLNPRRMALRRREGGWCLGPVPRSWGPTAWEVLSRFEGDGLGSPDSEVLPETMQAARVHSSETPTSWKVVADGRHDLGEPEEP